MLEWRDVTQWREQQATLAAIGKAQAVIEIRGWTEPSSTANERFLSRAGYTLEEIKGKHHGIFIGAAHRDGPGERALWDKLRRGEFEVGQYQRVLKTGTELWIQASYHPIFDASGKPFKVVELATNITEGKMRTADYEGQLAAISKAQAVIEFDLDGTIRGANQNFLSLTGYTLEELQGKHHSMLVEPDAARRRGVPRRCGRSSRAASTRRAIKCIAKGGRELWMHCSFNPIVDATGRLFKVVEYATDSPSRCCCPSSSARRSVRHRPS